MGFRTGKRRCLKLTNRGMKSWWRTSHEPPPIPVEAILDALEHDLDCLLADLAQTLAMDRVSISLRISTQRCSFKLALRPKRCKLDAASKARRSASHRDSLPRCALLRRTPRTIEGGFLSRWSIDQRHGWTG